MKPKIHKLIENAMSGDANSVDRVVLSLTRNELSKKRMEEIEEYYPDDIIKQINPILDYCKLLDNRMSAHIGDGYRDMVMQSRVPQSLRNIIGFIEHLYTLNLRDGIELDVLNPAIRDLQSFGIGLVSAYVDSAFGDQLTEEKVKQAKFRSAEIAIANFDAFHTYQSNMKYLDENVMKHLGIASQRLNALEPYEESLGNVPVPLTMKKISHKQEAIDSVINSLENSNQRIDYIFPIAHGGIELGIEIGRQYRNAQIYTLLFSTKTRKQKAYEPRSDTGFLRETAEFSNILVEDWINTGETIQGIQTVLTALTKRNFPIATLKRTPSSLTNKDLQNTEIYHGQINEYKGQK